MTNSPPPDPRSSQIPLGFDEFIGIFVAFSTIGAILFWSLSPREQGVDKTNLMSPSPSPNAQPTLTPIPETISPVPVSPVPTAAPTELPVMTPAPIGQRVAPVVIPQTRTATPAPATPAPAEPINFVDVPQDFWARPFIDALSARGIVSGFIGDYFRPERPVTRAEFAALLQDAFDESPGQSTTVFKDVPSDLWAVRAINSATRAGFLRGYPGEVFLPQQEIPKAQVFVALATGLNLPAPSSQSQTLQVYQDATQIPNYAIEKVAAATEAGLVVNYPNQNLLNPAQSTTRAEVAAIIYQALVRAGKAEPIESQYLVRSNP